jgi:hypothetical protein
MSPEELMGFTLTAERQPIPNRHLYSTNDNSQFDGRNNNIRRPFDRH